MTTPFKNLAQNPQDFDSAVAWVEYGRCCLSLGQLDEAEAALSRALESQPDGGTENLARRLLAWVMVERRNWPAAERHWRAVLDEVTEPPEQVEAMQALARVTMELGQHDAAVDFAARACELCRQHQLNEQLDEAVMNHAWYLLSLERYAEGIAVVTEAGDGFNPPDPNFHRHYIEAFHHVEPEARDIKPLMANYRTGFLSRTVTHHDIRGVAVLNRYNLMEEARRVYARCFDASVANYQFFRLYWNCSITFNREDRIQWYEKLLQRSTEMLEAASPAAAQHRIWLHNERLSALYGLRDGPGFAEALQRLKNDPCAQETVLSELYRRIPAHERIAARMNGLEPDPMPKVFGIGLSRTATTSLDHALRMMGFVCAHYQNPYSWELINDYDIPLFDALTDNPIACQFEALYERYPQACFIYTVRPLKQWVKSTVSLIQSQHFTINAHDFASYRRMMEGTDPLPYGDGVRRIYKRLYTGCNSFAEVYSTHDRRVRDFFAARPEAKFLELNIFNGEGWPELAKFLGIPTPDAPFPWRNKAPPMHAQER